MQKVLYMEHSPGSCKRCMMATASAYVDMEIVEDFYGHVYYCIDCVRQMANVLGFTTPEQLAQIQLSHEEELDDLKAAIRHGNTVEYLAAHHVSLDSFIAWLEYEEIPRESAATSRHASDSGPEKSGTESGSVEPSNEQRPDSLSITF